MPKRMPTHASGTVPIDATATFIFQAPLVVWRLEIRDWSIIGDFMYGYISIYQHLYYTISRMGVQVGVGVFHPGTA
jgi:hypothetical protein